MRTRLRRPWPPRAAGLATADSPLPELLRELIRAAGLVRRIGVNLNQAVARLNATGQRSGDLLPYAAESMHRAERLDAVAEQVRKALRQCPERVPPGGGASHRPVRYSGRTVR